MGNFIDFIFGSICCSMLPPIYDTYANIKDQVKKLKNFFYLLDFPIFSEYNCSEFYSFPNTFDKQIYLSGGWSSTWWYISFPHWHVPYIPYISDSLTLFFTSKSNLATWLSQSAWGQRENHSGGKYSPVWLS